jgi:outer membrane receptor protein involved in Fe transport
VYQEDWKNTIVVFLDPQQGFGPLEFNTNGPNYRVRGGELQVVARIFQGLTVQGAATYNRGSQVNSPLLVNNNPASLNFGKPITSIPNVYGLQGSPLAQSPEIQGNLRLRYEFPLGKYRAFMQVGGQYFGSSYSSTLVVDNYRMPGYATFDASTGIAKAAWNVQFFVQNLGNKNASTYTYPGQYVVTETVIRPRIAGIQLGYKF